MDEVIVVGGGAAGLISAGLIAQKGKKVILLEANNRLGKKLLITGKGRCNITNASFDVIDLINNIPRNGNFLYSSFYRFSNLDIIDFFENNGLKLKTERGGRVFPQSDLAKDVVDTLYKNLIKNNVSVKLNCKVTKIITEEGRIKGVEVNEKHRIACEYLLVCTGGASYPKTGSDGNGYKLLKDVGHTITKIKPSLVPLVVREKWIKELQGLSLKNIAVVFKDKNGKKIYNDFGEMIFTHFGVSGPVILSGSSHLVDFDFKDIFLYIDFKPALSNEKLENRIIRDFDKYSKKQFKNSLNDLLPTKLIPIIIKLSDIPEEKFVNQITKEERKRLVILLKNFKLEIVEARSIKEAIVTSGGVLVNEINSSTMESKIVKNLFLAGEMIDIDAYTGGYNLTIAFSTGCLAGNSISKK
jgi:predicted Rossmann fold flavoprotein